MPPKTSASSEFHFEAAEVVLTVAAQLASSFLLAAPPVLLLLLFDVYWPTDRTPVPMHTVELF